MLKNLLLANLLFRFYKILKVSDLHLRT